MSARADDGGRSDDAILAALEADLAAPARPRRVAPRRPGRPVRVAGLRRPVVEPVDQVDEQVDEQVAAVPSPGPVSGAGETARVRELRARVAEAHLLAELQADPILDQIEDPAVTAARSANRRAEALHREARNAAAAHLRDARVLRWVTVAAALGLVGALGWSTVMVQAFAAGGAEPFAAAWWAAWAVEPFLSLALLTVVAGRAYITAQGGTVSERAARLLTRFEITCLSLTLFMSLWPVTFGSSGTWRPWEWEVSSVVTHLIGPVVAIGIVMSLPVIHAEFSRLRPAGGTGRTYSANAPEPAPGGAGVPARPDLPSGPQIDRLEARVRDAIDYGVLRPTAGAGAIRRHLGCGMDQARAVRARLDQGDAR